MKPLTIFWFRRDLRLNDNHGLYQALSSNNKVLPLFIFDTTILENLPKDDHRVTFIYSQLESINTKLKEKGSSLYIKQGVPLEVFKELLTQYEITEVVTNEDYEPQAIQRDSEIKKFLESNNIEFKQYKDQVIFHKDEVVKEDGTPYKVYTPYRNAWKSQFNPDIYAQSFPSEKLNNYIQDTNLPWCSLEDIGFITSLIPAPPLTLNDELINHYAETRDIPANQQGTSHLSTYLRFGTISIREVAHQAYAMKDHTFLHELIWREFFMTILWHYPHTVTHAFNEQYDYIRWENNEEDFKKWKEGKTGYPLVDAGMRELNQTGYMHNRVRMVTASFLTKHLLIDWRWGERYFAEKLFDFELSSNVGNWQWVAGTGADAAPYFRVFNPETQCEKFDPDLLYVKKWVPEYGTEAYPKKIIEHKVARERCVERYKKAREESLTD